LDASSQRTSTGKKRIKIIEKVQPTAVFIFTEAAKPQMWKRSAAAWPIEPSQNRQLQHYRKTCIENPHHLFVAKENHKFLKISVQKPEAPAKETEQRKTRVGCQEDAPLAQTYTNPAHTRLSAYLTS